MPTSARKACSRCLKADCDCKKDRRPSSAKRGYGYRWNKFRLQLLAAEPCCKICLESGDTTEATQVHHVHKVSDGHDVFDNEFWCLCASCHSKLTAQGL
ncbi:HNH endonuclease signature motif containing protein [Gimesia maris]|uniref:HNH endonuclease signature motif containing protein n=1 Tax=Gimesia maris TaxID=122 RepID=UPI003C6D2939